MNALRQKLHSNRGVSILFALLVFLVCALAGAAALTAAASNAGRYAHLEAEQQRYLSVSSAAQLVRDELAAGTYDASYTMTKTEIWNAVTDTVDGQTVITGWTKAEDGYAFAEGEHHCTGSLASLFSTDLWTLFRCRDIPLDWDNHGFVRPQNPTPRTYSGLNVTATGDLGDTLGEVFWSLTLDGDYNFTGTFWVAEEGQLLYQLALSLPARPEVKQEEQVVETAGERVRTRVTTTTVTLSVTWPEDGAAFTRLKGGDGT